MRLTIIGLKNKAHDSPTFKYLKSNNQIKNGIKTKNIRELPSMETNTAPKIIKKSLKVLYEGGWVVQYMYN